MLVVSSAVGVSDVSLFVVVSVVISVIFVVVTGVDSVVVGVAVGLVIVIGWSCEQFGS